MVFDLVSGACAAIESSLHVAADVCIREIAHLQGKPMPKFKRNKRFLQRQILANAHEIRGREVHPPSNSFADDTENGVHVIHV